MSRQAAVQQFAVAGLAPAGVDLWRLPWRGSAPHPRREQYLAWLAEDERARYQGLRTAAARAQYLVGHGWLREVLARYLACEPARIALRYGAAGKPVLAAPKCASVHFNLAHTSGLLVLAVCAGPVGVDVEAHQVRDTHSLSRRFFSHEEQAVLAKLAGPAHDSAFYRLWTLKEAGVKASGRGIGRAWSRRGFACEPSAQEALRPSPWRFAHTASLAGYSIAVAARRGPSLTIRTFIDSALAQSGLCRENLHWLEHYRRSYGTSLINSNI
ncbi:4'-phosphopantetheinyl transferase family protein [Pseudomonas orientalis]|uniref:4'-phosphopantetheinyl transferase family protein n=1 Tax=Pseudomonas orientalis TaxID=76758 RepID=UPI0030D92FDD